MESADQSATVRVSFFRPHNGDATGMDAVSLIMARIDRMSPQVITLESSPEHIDKAINMLNKTPGIVWTKHNLRLLVTAINAARLDQEQTFELIVDGQQHEFDVRFAELLFEFLTSDDKDN